MKTAYENEEYISPKERKIIEILRSIRKSKSVEQREKLVDAISAIPNITPVMVALTEILLLRDEAPLRYQSPKNKQP